MTSTITSSALVAFGIGMALAGAPGPVQAVLLAEVVRGGIVRGFRALVGVHLAFGILMASLALGFSVASPHGAALRILKMAGGVLLLGLAVDGLRSKDRTDQAANGKRSIPPELRGALSILLNAGAWLFLGVVAAPLFASTTSQGGKGATLITAAALVVGAASGDAVLVMLGGLALRRSAGPVVSFVRIALASTLAAFGVGLLMS